MDNENMESTNENKESANENREIHQMQLEFLAKRDIEADLEEADLELIEKYQSFQ